jgi:hydroxymethylbilane synthase
MTTAAALSVLRLGTRRSTLARAQTEEVAGALRAAGCRVEIVGIQSTGDRHADVPLHEFAGSGVFVAELRVALLRGEVDVVVHSMKDLPTAEIPELAIAAIPRRADPRDALVTGAGCRLAELPTGAIVGTGSPRRAAQLRLLRPDLEIRPIRGNLDTRLGKLHAGGYAALIVAAAGLARLHRSAEAAEFFDPTVMLPAPGQGALAVECRRADIADGGRLARSLAGLDDPATRAAVTAERALLAAVGAGCSAPVGALGVVTADTLQLEAVVVDPSGTTAFRRTLTGTPDDAIDLGRRLAADLIRAGADQLLQAHEQTGEPHDPDRHDKGTGRP